MTSKGSSVTMCMQLSTVMPSQCHQHSCHTTILAAVLARRSYRVCFNLWSNSLVCTKLPITTLYCDALSLRCQAQCLPTPYTKLAQSTSLPRKDTCFCPCEPAYPLWPFAGAALVPVLVFGENDIWHAHPVKTGILYKMQEAVKRLTFIVVHMLPCTLYHRAFCMLSLFPRNKTFSPGALLILFILFCALHMLQACLLCADHCKRNRHPFVPLL